MMRGPLINTFGSGAGGATKIFGLACNLSRFSVKPFAGRFWAVEEVSGMRFEELPYKTEPVTGKRTTAECFHEKR
jgi:hypothetical protein